MRTAVGRWLFRIPLANAVTLTELDASLAIDRSYSGRWATIKEACVIENDPNRLILQQTKLVNPQLHCKLMGLRQDDGSGMTFMTNCNDATTTWNDEIAAKANGTTLLLKLKTGGQEMQFVGCDPSATIPKR
jgi:hypothetical protein